MNFCDSVYSIERQHSQLTLEERERQDSLKSDKSVVGFNSVFEEEISEGWSCGWIVLHLGSSFSRGG